MMRCGKSTEERTMSSPMGMNNGLKYTVQTIPSRENSICKANSPERILCVQRMVKMFKEAKSMRCERGYI